MTVLELLVVLGIVAGATAMAAASIPKLPRAEASASERVSGFVKEVRLEAMRSGRPLLLEIGHGVARSGERRIHWVAAEAQVRAGGETVGDYRAIVSSEGIISGAALGMDVGGKVVAVPGVYREPVR
jgi:Tfp pilus assembly protein FimT